MKAGQRAFRPVHSGVLMERGLNRTRAWFDYLEVGVQEVVVPMRESPEGLGESGLKNGPDKFNT